MKDNKKLLKFRLELFDLLAGTAFPFMLQVVLSVSFIGMAPALGGDTVLTVIMLCLGEAFLAAAYFIFGRQSGIVSVRKLVQNAKKREIGTKDRQALLSVGEYYAYKGFLIGFLSCIPYIIIQFIECLAHNTFCDFMLQYVFGWAALPFSLLNLSNWLNFVWILLPVAVHGGAYIFGAHREWSKQQKVANLQKVADKKDQK